MKYLIIDEDGQLRLASAPTYDVALRDLGPEGWDMVRCYQRPDLRGFVNDCGMLMPDRYPRNPVGSVLLASLGANIYPYCGKVLVTGWDEDDEIVSLDERQIYQLRTVHRDILSVLDGTFVPLHGTQAWAAAVREIAEQVRTGPLPTPTVLTGAEALDHLRRHQP